MAFTFPAGTPQPFTPPPKFQLGIIPQPVTFQDPFFGLVTGIEVMNIVAGQPAQQNGVNIGDIITRINGTSIHSLLDLALQLNASGGTVVLRVRDVNSGQFVDTQPITLAPVAPGAGPGGVLGP